MAQVSVDLPGDGGAAAAADEDRRAVPFMMLFRFADGWDRLLMAAGFTAAVCLGSVLPAVMQLFGDLITALAQGEAAVSRLCLETTVLAGVAWVMGWIAMSSLSLAGDRQTRALRKAFFSALLRQEVAMFDRTKVGELTNRMSSDVQLVSLALGAKLASLAESLGMFVACYAFSLYRCWRLTLVMMTVIPALLVFDALLGRVVTSATERAQESYAKAGAIAQEALSSIRTVQAFGAMDRECARYAAEVQATEWQGVRKGLFTGLNIGVTTFILFSSYAVAFWYGAILVEGGRVDGGTVVAVFMSILSGGFQLSVAAPIFTTIKSAQGAASKLYEIIDRVPAMDAMPETEGLTLPRLKGTIEFRDVGFRYPARPDVPIFHRFCLTVRPGEKVALVGPSGSGKSSVVALLERFYDVDEGQILIDGVPLTELSLQWWRAQVGLVTQEPTLFSATVLENILWANPGASREAVVQACKDAFIHDVIEQLPQGYDTYVGEGGSQLSGGQKQRVAIARAILRNPTLLLLDEATSALDRASETVVQEALNNVMRGRTVLTIAHRLVTVQDADRICFLQPADPAAEAGSPEAYSRLLESGAHAELMALNGAYAEMVLTQSRASEVPQPASPLEGPDAPFPSDAPILLGSIHTEPDSAKFHRDRSAISATALLEVAQDDAAPATAVVWRTAKLNAPEGGWLFAGAIGTVLAGTSYPVYSMLFSQVITVLYQPNVRSVILPWCLLFVALGAMVMAAVFCKCYCLSRAGERLTSRLRTLLFRSLVHQDMAFYDTPGNESGTLCARLATDTTQIQTVWAGALGTYIQAVVCLGAGLAIAFLTSWKLALVTASAIPPLVIASFVADQFMFDQAEEKNKNNDDGGQVAAETITSCRTVFAFNMQHNQQRRYEELLDRKVRAGVMKALVFGFSFGFSQFAMDASFALSYWYGGALVRARELGLEEVLRCSFGVLMGAMGVGEVFAMSGDQGEGRSAAQRVFRLLDRRPAVDCADPDGLAVRAVTGRGAFEDVSFHYPSRRDVRILHHLRLHIGPGQRVALLGATGCGKSTIVALLMRFYDPSRGQVRVEGQPDRHYDPVAGDLETEAVPLPQLNLQGWRKHCGIVSQEPVLFDDTVEANIRYGKPDATEEEVHAAARRAQVHDFILSLPQGYHTVVGAKGSQLSGGQKQRVAIARCIIRRPTLLLLDEATSALDAVSEREVQAALDEIITTEQMTVVVVAHRLSTIKNCNAIVLMSEGRIVESGTHEQLYAAGGEYRRQYDQYYNLPSAP